MLDLRMVDVAISLALLYMMMAGFVSGLQEWLSNAVQMRGKHLQKGISTLLHEVVAPNQNDELTMAIYNHPLIEGTRQGTRLPSYITAATFSTILAEELVNRSRKRKGLPEAHDPEEFFAGLRDAVADIQNDKLRQSLTVVLKHAGNDAGSIKQALESHFDNTMERVSGWYKRNVQWMAFGVALTCSVAFNVDSLAIVKKLNSDPALTAAMVDQAAAGQQLAAEPTVEAASQPATLRTLYVQSKQIKNTALPLGWENGLAPLTEKGMWGLFLTVLGWVITAAAATLGAPFWFDVISRLVPLRSSNKPAAK